jgi:hypothetical protein
LPQQENAYYMAGLQPSGRNLSEWLSPTLLKLCDASGLPCRDPIANAPANIQHSNYDEVRG